MVAIQKNETEQFQITIREFKAKKYLDIRLWYQSSTGGEYIPTKKGVSMALDLLPEFQRVIANLNAEALAV